MNKNKISAEMEKIIDIFKDEMATIRTGRASPALIEDMTVSVYGGYQKKEIK